MSPPNRWNARYKAPEMVGRSNSDHSRRPEEDMIPQKSTS